MIIDLVFSSLRNAFGQYDLQEILEKTNKLSNEIYEFVDEHIFDWGAKVKQVFLRSIKLDEETALTLSKPSEERKLAETKIIIANAALQSAHLFKNCSEILNTKAAMSIKNLESLKQFAESENTSTIFMS
eukprot:TRINITY_DN941_c0_g2_i2.p2 TRINITY_DN941_c0_g2~~TRINITY_DN941_c0_g2_i2.p2  ORF type:complete len:130 (+),score=29.73 TRINITY_DN941_c0_g2_i2:438-827(+)